MDFRKLSAFCKVYEQRSFSRAGEELFLSQPTVSAHIIGLEEELGVRLFDRLGRSVLPTGPAEVLYKTASEIFRKLEMARSEIELMQDRVSGTLDLGASTIPGHWILPPLLAEFAEIHPAVRFSLNIAGTAEIIEAVESGSAEIGMVGAQPDRPGFEVEPVANDVVVAVVLASARQRLLDGETEMDRWPWIMREPYCGTRLAFERALARGKRRVADFHTVANVTSTHAVVACTRAGLGVGVVSRLAVERFLESGEMQEVDLGLSPLVRTLYLIRKKGRTLFPATETFMRFVLSRSAPME
jgi:DNA-binding transcriptional LysR family regulator